MEGDEYRDEERRTNVASASCMRARETEREREKISFYLSGERETRRGRAGICCTSFLFPREAPLTSSKSSVGENIISRAFTLSSGLFTWKSSRR